MFIDKLPDSVCKLYRHHCCTRTSDLCIFCNQDTTQFSPSDWNSICPGNEGIPVMHNWTMDIKGFAIPGKKDYGQIIRYRCTDCHACHVERDYE